MASLSFSKSGNLWKANLSGTSCTLQVQLKSIGIVSIEASLSGHQPVIVDRYTGDNMLRKIDLPSGCTVTVVSNTEVVKASYV